MKIGNFDTPKKSAESETDDKFSTPVVIPTESTQGHVQRNKKNA